MAENRLTKFIFFSFAFLLIFKNCIHYIKYSDIYTILYYNIALFICRSLTWHRNFGKKHAKTPCGMLPAEQLLLSLIVFMVNLNYRKILTSRQLMNTFFQPVDDLIICHRSLAWYLHIKDQIRPGRSFYHAEIMHTE